MSINKVLLFMIVTVLMLSCKDEKTISAPVNNNEPINIEFLKEGELKLINNDSVIKQIDIELAKSANERAIGLMNRNSLEENQGMLFIFEEDNFTGFYMKDTRIALDIIFIGQDSTVISMTKNRRPFDPNSEGATEPYRYVLEVNGGKADEWGIREGITKIDWVEIR